MNAASTLAAAAEAPAMMANIGRIPSASEMIPPTQGPQNIPPA